MNNKFIRPFFIVLILLIFSLLISSCLESQDSPTLPQTTRTPVPTKTESVTDVPNDLITLSPTVEENPILTFNADIPEWVKEIIIGHPDITIAIDNLTESTDISFTETPYKIGEIQYFLVTAFNTPTSFITLSDFNDVWSIGKLDNTVWGGSLKLTEESEKVLVHRWGEHENGVTVVQATEKELIESLYEPNDHSFAIIPAQFLSVSLRAIRIDENSFFQPNESLARSIFSVPIYSSNQLLAEPININFSTEQLSTVNMTGVTALVRATAVLMRKNGNLYPAEQIIDFLIAADYTHISNEVSFSPTCPPQQYTTEGLLFCSPISTFELIEGIDTDIIELTGDHLEDYGTEAFLYTLEMYNNSKIPTYGAGENISVAKTPLKIDHHGNKFAFVGCNAKNPSYARAGENYPGTWFCDLEILKQIILDLQSDGYTPIITIQHQENELITPPEDLVNDFDELTMYPPIILIGTQAHVTKPFSFEKEVFIHYGLGNLFFDQVKESDSHTEALIDRLVFYNNQLVNIELYPIKFIDYAQSRPMTPEEQEIFLSKIFSLSKFPQP